MKMKLYNFEYGTFQQKDRQLELKIDRNQFNYDELRELNVIKKTNPFFLGVKKISEKDGQVTIQYTIPNEYQNLTQIKKEPRAIRTAIAKQIIQDDVLNNLTQDIEYVSLNPTNVWYFPMKNVKYAYRANSLMPLDHKHTYLEKYKAVILFCLTGAPYEKLLDEPKIANQKNDELLNQIINAKSVKQLSDMMRQIDNYVEYSEWKDIEKQQAKVKQKMWLSIGAVALIGLILIGLENKSWKNKYQALQAENVKAVREAKESTYLDSAMKDGKYHKAKVYMDQMGYSKAKQIQTFEKYGAYQQALNVEPGQLDMIVNRLYQKGEEKKVLDLSLPSSASSNESETLKLDQAILNYDTTTLQNELSFCENGTILLRMGEAYIEHNDLQDAQTTVEKLEEVSATKGKYLNAQINLAQANQSVANAKQDLANANKLADNDNTKKGKVESAKSELTTARNKQRTYRKEVKKLKREVNE